MTELSFAKSFLAILDSRPIKLQSDYAADPKIFEPKGPPLTTSVLDLKQAVVENIGNTSTEKIKLLYKKKPCSDSKSLKDVVGDEVPPGGEAEFSVMIMGGAASGEKPDPSAGTSPDVVMGGTGSAGEQTKDDAPIAQGMSGKRVLDTEEFWNDLQGFLTQRIRDQEVAEEALKLFRSAWSFADGGQV
ncbi:MAG: hypothetical protein Q9187_000846 [Circinaria calcarea]